MNRHCLHSAGGAGLTMKAYGEMEVYHHSFLNSALYGDGSAASRSSRFLSI